MNHLTTERPSGPIANAALYFHAPCFDGLVSATIAFDFLERVEGWTFTSFVPVGYDARNTWLSGPLERVAAVVDFLYHPDATFWADHHSTAFLTSFAKDEFRRSSRNRPYLIYNERYSSCAKLLWDSINSLRNYQNPRYAEIVEWADKIDSARYTSVEEAILGNAPALLIRC